MSKKKKHSKTGPAPLTAMKPAWQQLLVIIILSLAVYSNTLKNDFVYDDMDIIIDNSLIRNTGNIPVFFTRPVLTDSSTPGLQKGYRPLLMATFTLNYMLGRLNPAGYHFGKFLVVPHFMHEHAVDAHGEDLHPQLLERGIFFGNCRNLCRSDKSEITGVETDQHPFP